MLVTIKSNRDLQSTNSFFLGIISSHSHDLLALGCEGFIVFGDQTEWGLINIEDVSRLISTKSIVHLNIWVFEGNKMAIASMPTSDFW